MKYKFQSIFFTLVLVCLISLSAQGAIYYDDGTNDDNPDIDKFVPTHGVKIKESKLAGMMENATRNAMESSKDKKSSKKSGGTYQKTKQSDDPYKRSYKWF